MSQRIQLRRGLKANLPTTGMNVGEPMVTTDRGTLHIAIDPTTRRAVVPAIEDLTTMPSVEGAADLLIMHDASESTGQKEKRITFDNFKSALKLSAGGLAVWTTMATTPANINFGALVYPGTGNFIYALQGGNTTAFWRYSISGNSWTTMATTPANINGGALVYPGSGDFIYALQGGGTTAFWRYSISGNSWTTMATTPAGVSGGTLVYPGSGDFIYALQGINNTAFWRYSISGNSWTAMATTPAAVSGGTLVYPGSGNFIYALQGGNNTAFWRYSISGNSWTTMATTPAAVSDGALVYPGSGDFIYALQGNNTTAFWRYSISGNSWTTMATTPAFTNGGALVYPGSGDFIYALQGSGTTTFWRYNLNENLEGTGIWKYNPDTLAFIVANIERMRINELGDISVGGIQPNGRFHVIGTAGNEDGTWSNLGGSDFRIKRDIQPIKGALDKITKLEGVTYYWQNPEEHNDQFGMQTGFVAQNVQEVYPDSIIEFEPKGADKSLVAEGEKIISYGLGAFFNATVVEAIKELNSKINNLAKFEVGSSENPAGITMFDNTTKEAYSVIIDNGEIVINKIVE